MMSIDRDSSVRSIASRSASSTTTNSPFDDLPAPDDLVRPDLAVVRGAPALLLDRRQALAVELAEADVALARRGLRGQGQSHRDADQAERDGSVPDRAHGLLQKSNRGPGKFGSSKVFPPSTVSPNGNPGGHRHAARGARRPAEHDSAALAGRGGGGAEPPGLPRRGCRGVGAGLLGRGRDSRGGARERAAGARRQEGRRLRDPRADEPRVGAVRLRARPRRCRRRRDLREQRRQGLRVHPRPLRVGRRARPGRGAAREDRGLSRAQPEARARSDVRRPRRPRVLEDATTHAPIRASSSAWSHR